MKATEQEITVHVSRGLLAKAEKASRTGISDTVREGLELPAASETYNQLLNLKGKVRFAIDLDERRKDRR